MWDYSQKNGFSDLVAWSCCFLSLNSCCSSGSWMSSFLISFPSPPLTWLQLPYLEGAHMMIHWNNLACF